MKKKEDEFAAFLRRYLAPFLATSLEGTTNLHAQILAEIERPLMQLVLEATKGNQVKAAAILGLNRNTLRKRLRELGVDIAQISGTR